MELKLLNAYAELIERKIDDIRVTDDTKNKRMAISCLGNVSDKDMRLFLEIKDDMVKKDNTIEFKENFWHKTIIVHYE